VGRLAEPRPAVQDLAEACDSEGTIRDGRIAKSGGLIQSN